MTTPSLTPMQLNRHTCKQGNYGDIVPKLPMGSMSVGPSGSGKTVFLTNMILGIDKECFSRVYYTISNVSISLENANASEMKVISSLLIELSFIF